MNRGRPVIGKRIGVIIPIKEYNQILWHSSKTGKKQSEICRNLIVESLNKEELK